MNTDTAQLITPTIISDAYTYEDYSKMVADLLDKKTTTNGDDSPEILEYTKMNIHRSARWDKRGKLTEETQKALHNVDESQIWLVISEGWCGDAAQSLPFIAKMAEVSDNIELKIILRDQNLEIMDEFLTNGSRSIPKVIVLDADSLEVKGSWGPRPAEAQEMYMSDREKPDFSFQEAAEKLHLWYAKDKGQSIQDEFVQLLNSL
jgi:hypothetical protein